MSYGLVVSELSRASLAVRLRLDFWRCVVAAAWSGVRLNWADESSSSELDSGAIGRVLARIWR